MPPDRDVVDVLEKMYAKGIDEALADEYSRIDGDGDTRFGDEVCVERCRCRNEVGCCVTESACREREDTKLQSDMGRT